MRLAALAIAALSIGIGTVGAQETSIEAGEAAFRRCVPCHSVGEDAANKVGPVLNG